MISEILRPRSVQEALKAGAMPDAAFLGGGTWLNAAPSDAPLTLVSLENLGLEAIDVTGVRCLIGSIARFQQVVDHPGVPRAIRAALALTGSRTLRNMITVGGEVAHHPADSALVPVLLALGAEVSLGGRKKNRTVEEYLDGADGLILSVTVNEPSRPAAVRALSRTSHSTRSLVVAAAADAVAPRVSGLRIFASDCVDAPVRLARVEEALEGKRLPPRDAIEKAVGESFSPKSDMHASAAYKQYMVRVLVADALLEMAERRGAA